MSIGLLASNTSTTSARGAGGGGRTRRGGAAPAGGVAQGAAILGRGGRHRLDRGQQDRLDGALDGAYGQALLHQTVGLLGAELGECGAQARRRRWALGPLAHGGGRGGDVAGG